MNYCGTTRKEMWAKQQISSLDVDYNLWTRNKKRLQQLSSISSDCFFTVDVYKGRYSYASENFSSIFGYKLSGIRNIEKEGDFLENRIHPDDQQEMINLQLQHSQFIYSLPLQQRNNYQTIYQFRMLNLKGEYVNVISRQQVLQTDQQGKAWIILGILNISPQQSLKNHVEYSVLNRKTGEITSYPTPNNILTDREKEILYLIQEGWLSKEIANKLNISIHTINNHRKNILAKLDANNSLEAISYAYKKGIF